MTQALESRKLHQLASRAAGELAGSRALVGLNGSDAATLSLNSRAVDLLAFDCLLQAGASLQLKFEATSYK